MAKKKQNMTVTARTLFEKKPLSTHTLPQLPGGQVLRTRLAFDGMTPKIDCSKEDLISYLSNNGDCIIIPDTNFFTTEIDTEIWQAILNEHVLIVPAVWKELEPWLENPFYNKPVHDIVLQAAQAQSVEDQAMNEYVSYPDRKKRGAPYYRRIEILKRVTNEYYDHAYKHYFNLLALRKTIGFVVRFELEHELGRKPTEDELYGKIQQRYGERGLLLAKKGLLNETSPNLFTDEQLVVMAIQTGIIRKKNVILLTRDTDVLEQYFKLLAHLKEHYRSMLAADIASDPTKTTFVEARLEEFPAWSRVLDGESILVWRTTEEGFDVLPRMFRPLTLACYLVGGSKIDQKITLSLFCAEAEMSRMLRIKSMTNGLSTDKFNEVNCYIETRAADHDNHEVIVYIGKDKKTEILGQTFNSMDVYNTLHCNEKLTRHVKT